jgi:Holliday junction resolvasome RuvABC endonuclease subunit
MTILACDPSLTAWGWVIVGQDIRIIDGGCIKTAPSSRKLRIRKGDDRCRRITKINHALLELIDRYNVGVILSEQPHGSQNAATAVMIGICLGIVQTIADTNDLVFEWYLEGDCKECLLGKRSAKKEETVRAIQKLYPYTPFVDIKYIDEAVADAMCVFHFGKVNSNIFRFFV